MKLPCKDCITFATCKINKIESTDQCRDLMQKVYTKCTLIHDYVEQPADFEIEKIERFLEIILYLCDGNLYVEHNHLSMDYEGNTIAYYCLNEKRLIEIVDHITCPICDAKIVPA